MYFINIPSTQMCIQKLENDYNYVNSHLWNVVFVMVAVDSLVLLNLYCTIHYVESRRAQFRVSFREGGGGAFAIVLPPPLLFWNLSANMHTTITLYSSPQSLLNSPFASCLDAFSLFLCCYETT